MGTSFDPLGHIKIAVSDYAGESRGFYQALFGELGYEQVDDGEDGAGWQTPEGLGIWVSQAEVAEPKYVHGAPGLHHFCLKASSPKRVDKIHQFLVAQGVHIFNTPQAYPQYTPDYYAVFFADPDGIKLEVAYY